MTCEHQESRERTFYISNCPSIKSLPGHTLITQVCFVPSASECTELMGPALGVWDFPSDGNCVRKECYSQNPLLSCTTPLAYDYCLAETQESN
jgi:hypothetical protein